MDAACFRTDRPKGRSIALRELFDLTDIKRLHFSTMDRDGDRRSVRLLKYVVRSTDPIQRSPGFFKDCANNCKTFFTWHEASGC